MTFDILRNKTAHFLDVVHNMSLKCRGTFAHSINYISYFTQRDLEVLTSTLVETFTEWVYPLMHVSLPAYKPGYTESLQVS